MSSGLCKHSLLDCVCVCARACFLRKFLEEGDEDVTRAIYFVPPLLFHSADTQNDWLVRLVSTARTNQPMVRARVNTIIAMIAKTNEERLRACARACVRVCVCVCVCVCGREIDSELRLHYCGLWEAMILRDKVCV